MSAKQLENAHLDLPQQLEGIVLRYNQFVSDCDLMISPRHNDFGISPKERFLGRIEAIIQEIEGGERTLPSRFVMRLENRHCICNCRIDYVFEVMHRNFFEQDIRFEEANREGMALNLSPEMDIIFLYVGTPCQDFLSIPDTPAIAAALKGKTTTDLPTLERNFQELYWEKVFHERMNKL